jgi:hypothetical protein
MHMKFWSEKAEEKRLGGRRRRRWEYDIWVGMCELDSSGLALRPVAGCCEHGNKPSASINGGNFLTS